MLRTLSFLQQGDCGQLLAGDGEEEEGGGGGGGSQITKLVVGVK